MGPRILTHVIVTMVIITAALVLETMVRPLPISCSSVQQKLDVSMISDAVVNDSTGTR